MNKKCSNPNHVGLNPLPLSDFYKSSSRKDGYDPYCKVCKKAKARNYRENNSDKVADQNRTYKENNPNFWKEYYQNNRDVLLQNNHQTYLKKSGDYKLRAKYWRSQNLDYYAHKEALRRATLKQATPPWCEVDEIRKLFRRREQLNEETGVEHHVDHIVPLQSDLVCGLHCIANLQLLPASENITKSNKL